MSVVIVILESAHFKFCISSLIHSFIYCESGLCKSSLSLFLYLSLYYSRIHSLSLTHTLSHTYALSIYLFSHRIEVREVGGRKVIVFAQQEAEDTSVATIVIRASTEHVLNDVEVHYLHDIML